MIYKILKGIKKSFIRNKYTIGIAKEIKNQWERRTPITPFGVSNLIKDGIDVQVQSCSLIVFIELPPWLKSYKRYQFTKRGPPLSCFDRCT